MSPQWTEPLLLVDGEVPGDDTTTAEPNRWRRLRSYVDLGLLVALVAAGVFVARNSGTDSEQPTPVGVTTGPTVEVRPERAPYPLLVAPAAAEPGEEVSIVAYRRRDLCGDIELRLDGSRLEHQVAATIESPSPDWDALLLTVRIQTASLRAVHELELIGSVPGRGRGGPRCGDGEQRRDRIATASVVVSPSAE